MKPKYIFKIIIIGDSQAGKSSLMHRYCKNMFDPTINETIGIDLNIKTTTYNGDTIKLRIWDTAGQERFRTITDSYYHNIDGIIVAFDATKSQNVEKWIQHAKTKCESTTPIVIAANKTDKVHNMDEIYLFSHPYITTSAKTGENVNLLFETLIKLCIEQHKLPNHSSIEIEEKQPNQPCFLC